VASTLLSTAEKLRHQRKRERAVAVDVERMYAERKRTMRRRAKVFTLGGGMRSEFGGDEATRELVRLLSHTVVAETELLDNEQATGDAITARAERREELTGELVRLRATECPKAEIKNAATRSTCWRRCSPTGSGCWAPSTPTR